MGMNLRDKIHMDLGGGAYGHSDVKEAVLEFRKGLDMMCEYGYDDTPNDIFQTFDEIFGDFTSK